MKFTLNENYILNEKYILNEAEKTVSARIKNAVTKKMGNADKITIDIFNFINSCEHGQIKSLLDATMPELSQAVAYELMKALTKIFHKYTSGYLSRGIQIEQIFADSIQAMENFKNIATLDNWEALKQALKNDCNKPITADTTAASDSEDEKETKKADTATKEHDWTAEYRNVVTNDQRKKFWDDYYSIYWRGDKKAISFLEKIEYAFVKECQLLGFTEYENPFIAYIKWILNNNFDDMSYEQYVAINNAYSYNKDEDELGGGANLSGRDLRGKGKLKKYNLIFCPGLFSNSSADIEKYLEKQIDFLKAIVPNSTSGAKLRTEKQEELESMGINVTSGNVLDAFLLFFFNAYGKTGQNAFATNSLPTTLELFKKWPKWFDGSVSHKTELTDKTISSTFKDKSKAQKACAYILGRYAGENVDYKAIATKYGFDIITAISMDDIAKYKKQFNKYNINETNALTIIEKIANAGGLVSTKPSTSGE